MAWSGGNYTKGNNATGGWVGDASLGIGMEAGRHDTQDDDFATGINQCLNKDGSNAATGPLNAGGFKLTNIANATNSTDAMAYGQIRNGTPLYMDTVNNRVGIGTTTPGSLLTVGDGTGSKVMVVNGGNTGTSGGCAFTWQNGSNPIIAIGNYSGIYGGAYNASPTIYNGSGLSYRVGNMTAAVGTHFMKWNNATGDWTYDTSSARYKDNIENSSYGLTEVLAMRPVTFTYKAEPNRHDVGFIAEEMVNVIPEVVAKTTEGEPDAISYDRLTAVLCKAIQELEARVAALEAA
jgi:hypothetical protein